jgi:erythronate-4-phosphate dehydrogenase
MPLEIALDGRGKSDEQLFFEAITHTYPIREDSDRLKQTPSAFEELRGGYRIRREFKNFTVRTENVNRNVCEALKKIGFKIENTAI